MSSTGSAGLQRITFQINLKQWPEKFFMMRFLMIALPALTIALSFGLAGIAEDQPDELPPAPEFKLTSVKDGKEVSLAEFRGRIVFITFFNEGCIPCRDEVPVLNSLSEKYPEEFTVIGIGYQERSRMHLLGVKERMGIEFLVLLDSKGLVARAYKVGGLPAGYLVNERGELLNKYIGRVKDKLEADVAREVERIHGLKANRSVWVDEFNEATTAAEVQELGTKVRQAVISSLEKKGYPLAEKKRDAGFVIRGSVSGLGLIAGVNIKILRQGSRKPIDEFNMSPKDNDFSLVADQIIKRLDKL
jgi:thiol-disulfide isomerase/thioredoxin